MRRLKISKHDDLVNIKDSMQNNIQNAEGSVLFYLMPNHRNIVAVQNKNNSNVKCYQYLKDNMFIGHKR